VGRPMAGEDQIVALARHADGDVPDAGPGVELGAERVKRTAVGAAANAAGMSSALRMSWTCSVTPSERAAPSIAFTCIGAIGSARNDKTSTRSSVTRSRDPRVTRP
jgi:hypothetical protein